jgi:hypothetical protein
VFEQLLDSVSLLSGNTINVNVELSECHTFWCSLSNARDQVDQHVFGGNFITIEYASENADDLLIGIKNLRTFKINIFNSLDPALFFEYLRAENTVFSRANRMEFGHFVFIWNTSEELFVFLLLSHWNLLLFFEFEHTNEGHLIIEFKLVHVFVIQFDDCGNLRRLGGPLVQVGD